MEKLLKGQLKNYRELLALSSELYGKLSENLSEEAGPLLAKREVVLDRIRAMEEKIVNSGGGIPSGIPEGIPEGSETYSEIGKILEEVAAIDGKCEKYLKEGKEGIIESVRSLQKGKNAAKGYGSGRGKQQGGSGKFISIKE